MEARVEITSGPWAIAAFIGAVVLVIALYVFVAAPIWDLMVAPVSDDRCMRLGSGEPDREDPDCHSRGWPDRTFSPVEAWDREHPAP